MTECSLNALAFLFLFLCKFLQLLMKSKGVHLVQVTFGFLCRKFCQKENSLANEI